VGEGLLPNFTWAPLVIFSVIRPLPDTSCFYGNWVEDVRAGQFIIRAILLAVAWLVAARASVAVLPMCDSA